VSFVLSNILLFLVVHIIYIILVTIFMYLLLSHSGAALLCSLSLIAPSPLSILILGVIYLKSLLFSFHIFFASYHISLLVLSLHPISIWSTVSVSLHLHITLSCQFGILLN